MMSNGIVHSAGVVMSELLCLGSLLAFPGQYLILCARYDFFDWTVLKEKNSQNIFLWRASSLRFQSQQGPAGYAKLC